MVSAKVSEEECALIAAFLQKTSRMHSRSADAQRERSRLLRDLNETRSGHSHSNQDDETAEEFWTRKKLGDYICHHRQQLETSAPEPPSVDSSVSSSEPSATSPVSLFPTDAPGPGGSEQVDPMTGSFSQQSTIADPMLVVDETATIETSNTTSSTSDTPTASPPTSVRHSEDRTAVCALKVTQSNGTTIRVPIRTHRKHPVAEDGTTCELAKSEAADSKLLRAWALKNRHNVTVASAAKSWGLSASAASSKLTRACDIPSKQKQTLNAAIRQHSQDSISLEIPSPHCCESQCLKFVQSDPACVHLLVEFVTGLPRGVLDLRMAVTTKIMTATTKMMTTTTMTKATGQEKKMTSFWTSCVCTIATANHRTRTPTTRCAWNPVASCSVLANEGDLQSPHMSRSTRKSMSSTHYILPLLLTESVQRP